MRPRGALRGHGGIALCGGFIQFLRGHYALVVQGLHACIGLLHHFGPGFGLLPHLVGCLELLGARSAESLAVLGRRGSPCGFGLLQFGLYVGHVEEAECIAGGHPVALFYEKLQHTARNFGRDAVFRHLGFALDYLVAMSQKEEAEQGYEQHYDHHGEQGPKKIGRWFYFHIFGFLFFLSVLFSHLSMPVAFRR